MNNEENIGVQMYAWVCDLFPINRSITGTGVVQTIEYFTNLVPELEMHHVLSGSKACDWIVPDEWCVSEAYVETLDGRRVIDFCDHNLHLVGYSSPIDRIVSNSELHAHLYSLPEQPDAIPYVTSYYKRTWGFCVSHRTREGLTDAAYKCVISTKHFPGRLHFADLVIPGQTTDEIVISSYVCHPSMANNELSGPVMLIALLKRIQSLQNPKYTYRFILAPETIGALVYLERQGADWPKQVVGLLNLTCVGDNNNYSFLPSRLGNSYIDKISRFALKSMGIDYVEYDFVTRGSDERQYNAPLVNIPTVSIMRSKYNTYPEYHTSLDNLDFVSPAGLQGAYDVLDFILEILESNVVPSCTTVGEPQLGKYDLYDTLSIKRSKSTSRDVINFLCYADGTNDLVDICSRIDITFADALDICRRLEHFGLVSLACIH